MTYLYKGHLVDQYSTVNAYDVYRLFSRGHSKSCKLYVNIRTLCLYKFKNIYQETVYILGPFTVFGPTDEAFASLPPGVVDSLKKDHKLLAQVLEFHVLKGSVFSNQIKDEGIVPTLNPAASIRTNIYPWFEPKVVFFTVK